MKKNLKIAYYKKKHLPRIFNFRLWNSNFQKDLGNSNIKIKKTDIRNQRRSID